MAAKLLKKADIARPVLPTRAVPVAALGGSVMVRGLLFSERMALFAVEAQAITQVPRLLALTVHDADGAPVFSVDEWEAFGAAHPQEIFEVFEVAMELSGLKAEAVKKS